MFGKQTYHGTCIHIILLGRLGPPSKEMTDPKIEGSPCLCYIHVHWSKQLQLIKPHPKTRTSSTSTRSHALYEDGHELTLFNHHQSTTWIQMHPYTDRTQHTNSLSFSLSMCCRITLNNLLPTNLTLTHGCDRPILPFTCCVAAPKKMEEPWIGRFQTQR